MAPGVALGNTALRTDPGDEKITPAPVVLCGVGGGVGHGVRVGSSTVATGGGVASGVG